MARRRRLPDVLAAVDLGSNSFHMIVARYAEGRLVVLDRLREMVRLGAGMEADGRLSREAMARALAALERFGQRLKDVQAEGVRVVGTNALRKARRKQGFLERARAALGHPIEIISGIEEARLIYSGVAHSLPTEPGRRLVVDIGGGSTELIIGEGYAPKFLESLYMGCVSMSEEHFPGGRVSEKRFRRACVTARMELEAIENRRIVRVRRDEYDLVPGRLPPPPRVGDRRRDHDVLDGLHDRAGRDAVDAVVFDLLFPAPVRFVHRAGHRARDRIGVEDDRSLDIARGPAGRQ